MVFDEAFARSLTGRTELLTPIEMGRADALAPSHSISGPALMENAGRAVARAVAARLRPCRTLVLCGPGNNGGDGFVAARHLQQQGWPVAVASLAPQREGGDAAAAARRWHGPFQEFSPSAAAHADLVIDAVFGAGLSRDVDGIAAETLAAARRIVAVDVPSGLDGATGQPRGFAPRAQTTVTFFRLKPGHLLMPGRSLCGEIVLADIGLPASVLTAIRPSIRANHPTLWPLPVCSESGHKYDRGHVTVAGGAAMTGAARLAAQGARRGGAGLVTIVAPPEAADVYRAGEPGVIVSDDSIDQLLKDSRRHVWVCGPGLGATAARAVLPALLEAGRSVVADADALTAFATEPDRLRGVAVMTPHAGEFARVFGPPGADRVAAALAAASRTGATVLLKGPDTILAAPDGRVSINASAPPWLATAGAGDVLAGLVAGLMAQGMAAWEAASAATWLHGRAAAVAGPGMVAEDIAPNLAAAFRDAVSLATPSRNAEPGNIRSGETT
jgi:hydroxyethylthiazole kinase-like uncharacterized protein yjeF